MLAGEVVDQPVGSGKRRATRSELMLWERLRVEPHEWAREVPTKHRYVLDFYCEAAKLAVEVDGEYHNTLLMRRHGRFAAGLAAGARRTLAVKRRVVMV